MLARPQVSLRSAWYRSGPWLLAMFVLGLASHASAHTMPFAKARVEVRDDGSYLAEMELDFDDALAWSSRRPSEGVQQKDAAIVEQYLKEHVELRFDGRSSTYQVQVLSVTVDGEGMLARANLSGKAPAAGELRYFASRKFGDTTIELRGPRGATVRDLVHGGRESPAVLLMSSASSATAAPSQGSVFLRYLRLGIEHIIPRGLDHILFILGLFLLSTRLRDLVAQLSLFTIAHSITLTATLLGTLSLPSSLVESLIALSIAYVGIENLCVKRVLPWRSAVVFIFGLLHGMGFANVLGEIGLPPGQFALALTMFNVGVEVGQLAVVLLAAIVVGWGAHRQWYRARVVRPASIAIAMTGVFWLAERSGLLL